MVDSIRVITWLRQLFRSTPPVATSVPRVSARPPTDLAEGSAPKPVPTAPTPPPPIDVMELVGLVAGATSQLPDPEHVADLVERVRNDPGLISTMPSFPASSARIIELTERDNLDLNEIIRVLHWEPAAATEILRMANTAGFSRGKVDDLRDAVFTLGLAEVGSIAAAVGARALFDIEARQEHAAFARLWGALHHDALVTAFTASWLAQALHLPRYDRIFLRAVIGSCGRPLALRVIARHLVDGRCASRPLPQAILGALDELDAEVRDLALQTWDLPPSLRDVVTADNPQERAVVEVVQGMMLLRRAPHRLTVADRIRAAANTLQLDATWIRLVNRELDDAGTRVSAMFGTTSTSISSAAIQLPAAPRRGGH